MLYCCCFTCNGSEDEDEDNVALKELEMTTLYEGGGGGGGESVGGYSQVPTENDEELDGEDALESGFDPDEDFVKNFASLGWHTKTLAYVPIQTTNLDNMIEEVESVLTSASTENLTPREISTNLNKYGTCIRLAPDLEKKRSYIKRYEVHKFDLDEDNQDDKDKADLYTAQARNTTHKAKQRIEYYQTAIKFTNNYEAKQRLKEEYRCYVYSLNDQQRLAMSTRLLKNLSSSSLPSENVNK